jgi:competence protein ComGC
LYLDGLRFNADSDPSGWYSGLQYGWRFIVAVTLFVVLLVIAFCLGLYFPILYKQSKILYFQSEDYQQKVIEYGNADLSKYHIKNIKWLKKLGYIDKIRYQFYKNTKRHKKSIK